EERRLAVALGNDLGSDSGARLIETGQAVSEPVVGVDPLCIFGQVSFIGNVDDGDRAEKVLGVFLSFPTGLLSQRTVAFDIGDEKLFAIGRNNYGARIPAGWDQARDRAGRWSPDPALTATEGLPCSFGGRGTKSNNGHAI